MKVRLSKAGFSIKSFAVVLYLSTIQFSARVTAQNMALSGSAELDSALSRGDAKAVREIEESIGAGVFTKQIDDAQIRYDLPALARLSRACELQAFKEGVLEAALRCNTVARGAAMSGTGDVREYLMQTQWAKEILFPAIRAKSGGHADVDSVPDRLNMKALLDMAPAEKSSLMRPKTILPVLNADVSAAAAPPLVSISINGKPVPAFVDTGIAPNMIVTHTVAESLGLAKIVGDVAPVSYLGRSQANGAAGIYLARQVGVGNLQLHNILVGVVPDGSIPQGVYLGMAMLRRFGEVVIGNRQITLASQSSVKCRDPLPMTFATQGDEAGKLLFNIIANKRPAGAELDTGASFLLLGNSEFFPYRMTPQDHPGQVGTADIDATVGGKALSLEDAIVLHPGQMQNGLSVIIGNPVLRSYDVVLHLHAPSICFVEKNR